jgi:hypothetical protein
MACEEPAEPPILAAVGAVRWTKRKVVMNGADPCASAVSTDDVRVRHAEGGAGLSAGCGAIVRPWFPRASRYTSGSPGQKTVINELVKPKVSLPVRNGDCGCGMRAGYPKRGGHTWTQASP